MLKGTVELKSLANAANWGLCDLASVYPSSSRPLPWATRAFFLFFERASRAGTLGLCTSCFLPGVLFSKNSAVWLLIVCHSGLSLAFSDHTTCRNLSVLSYHSALFYFHGGSSLWMLCKRYQCPIATSLSFLLRESWFYLGSQRAHPNSHFSWAALYLDTVWLVKYKWMCAGSSWESFCSSDGMVNMDAMPSLPFYPPPLLECKLNTWHFIMRERPREL